MKKILLLICIALLSSNAFSQKGKKSLPIKTETDTISYSYGVGLAQQGLLQHLSLQGIITDTASVKQEYASKIQAETDQTKIVKLRKELNTKLDSIAKANKINTAEFISGITSSLSVDDKKKAYKEGLSMGGQLSKMLPYFSQQLYGDDKMNEINTDLFLTGLKDVLEGNDMLIDNAFDIVNEKMQANQAKLSAQKDGELMAKSAEYIAEGDKFMEANKHKDGVVTLPNGLQYKIIKEGTGSIPSADDQVTVHYRGSLIDGTVFDSSHERGEPTSFGVSQVIKGWSEALQLMPVGSKWMLYIPYDLAYGSRETGSIKAYSNLIFEIELLNIEK